MIKTFQKEIFQTYLLLTIAGNFGLQDNNCRLEIQKHRTLKFAQRVSSVELSAAYAHKETREVIHLKEQIEILKKALGTEEWNKEMKSPLSRQIATTEITPPRLRRLSIENGIKSPLASRSAQIWSLEGLKSYKKDETSKGDPIMEVHQLKNPLSPVNGGTSIPHFQLMQTPVKAEVDCRTSGKGSHIRKSLRTIGKLINGSEKRKENVPENPRSPLGVSNHFSGAKSPHTSNAKTLRRQSLTGQERSSIRVDPVENGIKGARDAKTPPPPERSSSKIGDKRA
ncbi:hypothetical protein DY000_02003873 [Brassica cretica]|uniref:DUF4005 domain-containing protein n=1 Tax=Brassica cretica TaxID=69181 RepID=A0ABQ7C2F2_BRACR|nr:hypothetical protein DY000_02003873 [Brassica cretica]